jgi:hypothetical protein
MDNSYKGHKIKRIQSLFKGVISNVMDKTKTGDHEGAETNILRKLLVDKNVVILFN